MPELRISDVGNGGAQIAVEDLAEEVKKDGSAVKDMKTIKLPTITCGCGMRYLVFRDIRASDVKESFVRHRFRDFYEPDGEDVKECKFCGASLEAVRRKEHE